MPEGKDAGRRALRNRARQNEMEWEIQKAFFAFFKWIKEQKSSALPALSEDINQSLIDLAELVVKARSGVIREYSYRQEIVFVPAAELPTRILQQLAGLTAASMILNGGVLKDEDLKMTFKTALDSIPQTNYMVLHQLAQGVNQTTKEIAIALGYPTSPIHRYLENLSMHGLCRRAAGKDTAEGGVEDRWFLKEEYQNLILRYHGMRPLELEKLEEEIKEETDPQKLLLNPESEPQNSLDIDF